MDGIIFLQDRIVIPMGLRSIFLHKIPDAHLGIVKSKLLGQTLVYWPNWNSDIEATSQNCTLCRENQAMPAIVPKFKVKANSPGEIYGSTLQKLMANHILSVWTISLVASLRESFEVYTLSVLLRY